MGIVLAIKNDPNTQILGIVGVGVGDLRQKFLKLYNGRKTTDFGFFFGNLLQCNRHHLDWLLANFYDIIFGNQIWDPSKGICHQILSGIWNLFSSLVLILHSSTRSQWHIHGIWKNKNTVLIWILGQGRNTISMGHLVQSHWNIW